MTSTHQRAEAAIEADPTVPAIHITRDFAATAAHLVRAHTDPELFVRWIGPNGYETTIDHWDARTGGSYRYEQAGQGFHGCFHHVCDDRLVQTFTWEGMPEGVSLDTMTFEDLGGGRTRMHATSLVGSFEARDGMLSSGMEVGVNDGYAKLDALLADGLVA
ncbi:SRPBCC family protein [Aeromicrobium halocynthiae]|uniref:SRPBCC family protein n=1 Tax=Aeromicrobium halocynthiae TaxID=560557 RepID=A0ABN2W351_9ACTN